MIAGFARGLGADAPTPPGLKTWNGSDPAQRFAVYRNNVALSLRGALAANFPLIATLVGEACFAALARAYLDARPPRSRRLALHGEDLGDFIEGLAPLASWPYLGDVARLEAARLHAYHAADAQALDAAAVFSCPDIANARPRLHPSLRLVVSRFALVSLVRLLETGAPLDTLDVDTPESALVARSAGSVDVAALTPAQAAFVGAALTGATLYDAAQAGAALDATFDVGAFVGALARRQLLVALIQESSHV